MEDVEIKTEWNAGRVDLTILFHRLAKEVNLDKVGERIEAEVERYGEERHLHILGSPPITLIMGIASSCANQFSLITAFDSNTCQTVVVASRDEDHPIGTILP